MTHSAAQSSSAPCDSVALAAYQDGTATQQQSNWLEVHLNTCVDCRAAMETDAANVEFWQAATDALSSFQTDRALDFSVDTRLLARIENLQNEDLLRSMSEDQLLERERDRSTRKARLEKLLRARLEPSTTPDKMGALGKYDIESIVGHGGMGLVAKAYDRDLGRHVAIKTLLLDRDDEELARQRLMREAKAAASLRHPNIIQIHSVEMCQDLPLIVMPFINGPTLQQLRESGTVPLDKILDIARQLAAALVAAHHANLIHRDIKPSNVLIDNDNTKVLLSDFGLARFSGDQTVTLTGILAGTPQFMSPEQAQGNELDHRTDIFSLGSLMYWLCTGRCPFQATTPYAILLKLVNDKPMAIGQLNAQIPSYVVALIERLMAKEASNRPNAAQCLQWIEQSIAHESNPRVYPLPTFAQPSVRKKSYRRLVLSGVAVAFIATLGSVMFMSNPQSDESTMQSVAVINHPAETVPTPQPDPVANDQKEIEQTVSPDQLRYGQLDEIDSTNMMEDFKAKKNSLYWLRRLAYLSVSDIPPESIQYVQELSTSSDSAAKELALVILSKNPFEVVTPYPSPEPEPPTENPFVEIDPSQYPTQSPTP